MDAETKPQKNTELEALKRKIRTLERRLEAIEMIQEINDAAIISPPRKTEEDDVEYTLKDIGEYLGVTKTRVRQILQSAIHKLKHPRVGRPLKKYTHIPETEAPKIETKIDFFPFIEYGTGTGMADFHNLNTGLTDERN